jgi:hypothetical protein
MTIEGWLFNTILTETNLTQMLTGKWKDINEVRAASSLWFLVPYHVNWHFSTLIWGVTMEPCQS